MTGGARPRRRSRRRLVWGLGALALAAVAGCRWVLVPYRVQGGSMLPTLVGADDRGGDRPRGDIVLVNRWAYAFSAPARWDVVVLHKPPETVPLGGLSESVKRIAGLPGETVELRDGKVWADGVPVEPPEGIRHIPVVRKEEHGYTPVRLGPHEYFVLGDQSYLSTDSRRWGPIPHAELRGRVEAILLPLARRGWVR